MKKALITGVSGQDGYYLRELLLSYGYFVIGVDRLSSNFSHNSFEFLSDIDLADTDSTFKLMEKYRPDEIYHLASCYSSSEIEVDNLSFFKASNDINCVATINILEWMRRFGSDTRLFYPTSCYIFGNTVTPIQNEDSSCNPVCIYGITKDMGRSLCKYYREKYDLFASVGILYNHESPLRSENFVSKKIVKGAVEIKNNKRDKLVLGDIDVEVDWGYAKDYVVAMYKMLQHTSPEEFVISSGERHTIKEFVKKVFDYLNLNWEKYIFVDKNLLKTHRKGCYVGDSRKISERLGWSSQTNLEELVKIMLNAELLEAKAWK